MNQQGRKQNDKLDDEVFQMRLNAKGIFQMLVPRIDIESIQGTCMQSIPNLHSCQELIKNKSQEVNKLVVTHKPSPNRIFKYVFKPLHEDFENRIVWSLKNHLNFTEIYILDRFIPMQRAGLDIWLAQETIAKECGKTREWINRCMEHLESLGLIAKYYRHKQTCLYRVVDLFFKKHISKLIGKHLEGWFKSFKSYVQKKFTLGSYKGLNNYVLPNLAIALGELVEKSRKCDQWFGGYFFRQRFEKVDFMVPPPPPSALSIMDAKTKSANRAGHYKKGGSYLPSYSQRTIVRQDEIHHYKASYNHEVAKTVVETTAFKFLSSLGIDILGYGERCKNNAQREKTPQLRVAPL